MGGEVLGYLKLKQEKDSVPQTGVSTEREKSPRESTNDQKNSRMESRRAIHSLDKQRKRTLQRNPRRERTPIAGLDRWQVPGAVHSRGKGRKWRMLRASSNKICGSGERNPRRVTRGGSWAENPQESFLWCEKRRL